MSGYYPVTETVKLCVTWLYSAYCDGAPSLDRHCRPSAIGSCAHLSPRHSLKNSPHGIYILSAATFKITRCNCSMAQCNPLSRSAVQGTKRADIPVNSPTESYGNAGMSQVTPVPVCLHDEIPRGGRAVHNFRLPSHRAVKSLPSHSLCRDA